MHTHHAFLYIGAREECLAQIPHRDTSSPDVETTIQEQFDIAEARALSEKAATRPLADTRRCFIVACEYITTPAQNALLKLFEDPPQTAQFHLIVPRASVLLPTLRSRTHLMYAAKAADDEEAAQAEAFLRASAPERLALIAALVKRKDTALMRGLIRGLEQSVSARISAADAPSTRAVLFAAGYSEARGASHKMLLEHLALALPVSIYNTDGAYEHK